MTTCHVFTYGSLMFAPVWTRVVRGEYASDVATIHGFRRLCVRGETHPALVVRGNAAPLVGRVYFDVSADDLARLDQFEGRHYERATVAVTAGGDARAAQAYLALNLDDLEDADWSVSEFEARGIAVFLATYVAANAPTV